MVAAPALLAADAAVLLGALVQGSVGFAGNLVAMPIVLLVAPAFVPVALLVNSALRSLLVLVRDRAQVDWPATRRVIAAQIPGLMAGAVAVRLVPHRTLEVVLALIVLGAVPVSLRRRRSRLRRRVEVAVAVASGAMTTMGSIGGPPLALLYQDRPAPVIRGTLAAVFTASDLLGLVALTVTGSLGGTQLVEAAVLIPGTVIGSLLSLPLARRADRRSMRPIVAAVVVVAGLAALFRALLG